jgi:hypothetical protein
VVDMSFIAPALRLWNWSTCLVCSDARACWSECAAAMANDLCALMQPYGECLSPTQVSLSISRASCVYECGRGEVWWRRAWRSRGELVPRVKGSNGGMSSAFAPCLRRTPVIVLLFCLQRHELGPSTSVCVTKRCVGMG